MEQTQEQTLTAEEQVARVARLSRCGLSADEIIFVLKERRVFVKDALVSPHQEAEAFSGSPYVRSFSAYLGVRYGAAGRAMALDEEARLRLVEVFGKKIKADALQDFLKKMEILARRICNPVIPEAFAPWHALLSDIFVDETHGKDEISWRAVWHDYIGDLYGKRATYPEGYRAAEEELTERCGEVIALRLRPRWTNEMGTLARERLTEALRLLAQYNVVFWQTICRYHGFWEFGIPSPLGKIATEEKRSLEQIRQRYISGLRFLAATLKRTAPGIDRFVRPEKGELATLYVRASEESRTLREKLASPRSEKRRRW